MAHKRRLVVMTIVLGMSVVAASSALGIARFTPGPVVATGELASVKPPWYVWNAKSCSFATTTNHPATYVAKLRKIPGFTLAYLPEGTGDPV